MKPLVVSGKRRKAIARAAIRQGSGKIRINNRPLDSYKPKIARLKLREPLAFASNHLEKVDIDINVRGGGWMGQAEASRLAVARALVAFTKDKALERAYLDYDRHLLVADVRTRETRKPNAHGKARAKTQKSYR